MMKPTLEAVFFDAAGTLIYLPRPIGEYYREVAGRQGSDVSADILEREFRRCWKTAPARPATRGGARPDDDKGWWRALVRGVLDAALSPDARPGFDHETYFEEVYTLFAKPSIWHVYPEAEALLRALRGKGLKLGVISNFDRRLYDVLEHSGLTPYFASITISSEAGVEKPAPSIFLRALDSLGVRAEAAVHVGDDPACDRGAAAVGMDVYELDRPARTLAGLPGWLESRASGQNALAPLRDLT